MVRAAPGGTEGTLGGSGAATHDQHRRHTIANASNVPMLTSSIRKEQSSNPAKRQNHQSVSSVDFQGVRSADGRPKTSVAGTRRAPPIAATRALISISTSNTD